MKAGVASSLQPGTAGDVSSFARKMLGEGCGDFQEHFAFLIKGQDASHHPTFCSALNRGVMPGAAAHVPCLLVSGNIVWKGQGGPNRKVRVIRGLFEPLH